MFFRLPCKYALQRQLEKKTVIQIVQKYYFHLKSVYKPTTKFITCRIIRAGIQSRQYSGEKCMDTIVISPIVQQSYPVKDTILSLLFFITGMRYAQYYGEDRDKVYA